MEVICGEPSCLKQFTNSECLKAHIESSHRYIKCEVCGARQLKKNFKRHKRAHDRKRGKCTTERVKCTFEDCLCTFSNVRVINLLCLVQTFLASISSSDL